MGTIRISGIRIFAYHGCLSEEGRIGGHYQVNITVDAELTKAEQDDHLVDTIDYGIVAEIVRNEMKERANLIEHVGHRILKSLRSKWPNAEQWEVEVVKEHPPIEGYVDHVSYTIKG